MDGHGPVNDPPVLTALKDHIALQYGRCLLNMNKFEMILKVVLRSNIWMTLFKKWLLLRICC